MSFCTLPENSIFVHNLFKYMYVLNLNGVVYMQYVVSFIYDLSFSQKKFEDKGKDFKIGSSSKDDIICDKLKQSQISINFSGQTFNVNAKDIQGASFSDVPIPNIIAINGAKPMFIYVDYEKPACTQTIKIPHNGFISIGRRSTNNVVIKNRFVSGEHCIIKRENGIFYLENKSESNGTYLNQIKATKSKLVTGDTVHIFNYTIRLDSGELFIENAGNDILVKDIEFSETNKKGTAHVNGERRVYRRSPRTQEQLPSEDIILAAPPSKQQKYEKPRGMLSSLVGTAAMFGTSMFTGGAMSAAMLAARSSMLIMPATNIATQKSSEKRGKKKSDDYEALRQMRFGNYLNEQRTRIFSVAEQQRKIITDENPSPADCIEITSQMRRNLWERTPLDRDFLDVRLGMGYENLCISIKDRGEAYGVELEDDDAKEMSAMLVEESKYVDNIPVRVSLKKNTTIGVIGNRAKVVSQVKNMVTELCTMHCFSDIRIVGVFDEEEKKQWEFLKWLPHIWDENNSVRYLSFDKESTHAICESFNDMLKVRIRDMKDEFGTANNVPIPYYIFILGSKKQMETEEIMPNLLHNNPRLGVTSLFLFDDIYNLPNACNYIIDVDNFPSAYERNKVNSKFVFSMDEVKANEFDKFARLMSSIELKGFASAADIPNSVTFLEGYGVKTVEELNIPERWQKNLAYKTLAAPIGVMGGEKIFSLNIRESKGSPNEHGPHGLVAGTTGSGKSELLQTWILSMCVNFHPNEVNFVLIDYKGGGMANLLEGMPHVVGKITNIASNIKRSIISLNREKERRMAVFEAAGVNNIDKYHKLYHEGKVSEPLPHLVICADEFAELKKEEPQFIADLVSVARVGRTLGIHLVLATQKPSGIVDDQISGNSRFRLCLKVQDAGDSREMIERPDASRITQAGRCYVRVGKDEVLELFQSFWSGAPYYGNSGEKVEKGNQVCIVETNGHRIKPPKSKKPKVKAEYDELAAINKYIAELAKEQGIPELRGPWLPDLEENIQLDEVVSSAEGFDGTRWNENKLPWLKVPVGKYDMPELQDQGKLCLDFAQDGHYGIYGASGTGKTVFLKTLTTSLCRNYTPEDVNIYIIDCGGWSMNTMSAFPHVGGVVLDVEEEKMAKFQKLINDEFDRRRKLFLENVVSSLAAYRETVGKMPAMVIMIDNIMPLFDLYPDMEDLLIRISRDGATYGIYLVFTANTNTGIRYKIIQNVKGAVAFELTDKGDYSGIVGRVEGKFLPKTSGRAFYKGSSATEFQTAWYADGDNEVARAARTKELASQMCSVWDGPLPRVIPVMPEKVEFGAIAREYKKRHTIPLGISFDAIDTAFAKMQKQYCFMVTGSIGSGKSALLKNIAKTISNEDNLMYFIDSSKNTFSDFQSSATGYALDKDDEAVNRVIREIVGMLNTRKDAQVAASSEPGFDPSEFILSEKQICIFIDDINEFIESVENETRNWMDNIARLAEDLGVLLFAGGRIGDVSKLADIEPLTSTIVKYQHGLLMDGSPSNAGFFNNNLPFTERDQVCGQGNAWLFNNGSCEKIKLP